MTSSAPPIVATSYGFPETIKLTLELLKDFLEFLRDLAAKILSGPLGNLVTQVLDMVISLVSNQVFTVIAYSMLAISAR